MSDSNRTTHFGFKTIATEQKEKMVAGVFHSVAKKYDLMNDVLSFGLHRIWKKTTIEFMNVQPGQVILDLAGGTGDFTAKLSPLVTNTGKVVLSDYNSSMLEQGKERLSNLGVVNNVEYVQANAECLPFENNTFDSIIISFGLRNVTHKDKAVAEMFRVLKPGGRAMILEFSKPTNQIVNTLYNLYSFKIMPKLGELIAGDADSYKYLAESISVHPDQETMAQMMRDCGFSIVKYQNFSNGIVALHRGFKLNV